MLNRKLLTLVILGVTLCLPHTAAALQKGETFPAISGETISGTSFELNSLKGEPILLKIGTTWCGTCKQQTKTIDQLRDFMADNGINYVDVFVQESSSKVAGYFSNNGYQLPEFILLDDGDISKALNIYLIPRIILIDKNFKVYRDGDTLSEKNLKNSLQALLAE